MSTVHTMLITAVAAALPIFYASLGELIGERVGVMNLGIEGVMMIGAVVGYGTAVSSGSLPLSLAAAAAAGGAFALVVVAIPAVWMRAPQILVGFAAWFIGLGVASQLGASYGARQLKVADGTVRVPLLSAIPWVGDIFFAQPWVTYAGVALALIAALVLARTRHGLALRAIGEDPASAHAAGVPVRRWQTIYVTVGGALTGTGGAILSVVIAQSFQDGMTSGRGFVAFALVLFVGWRPLRLLWASYLFGILLVLGAVGQSKGWGIPSELLAMAPYVFTVAALVLRAGVLGGTTSRPPASLGIPFTPGEK